MPVTDSPVCAWCGEGGKKMAVVRTPEHSRDAVLAIDLGITIRHTLCSECRAAGKHRYPPNG